MQKYLKYWLAMKVWPVGSKVVSKEKKKPKMWTRNICIYHFLSKWYKSRMIT